MAFIRAQKRKTKSGIRTYYYLVENKWENGKVKQKVLKYIGTNPNKISVDLTVEQCTAILGSSILSTATAAELKRKFQEIDQNGGYVLQIDGTQNHGRGTIILLKDSISNIRLFSTRVVSEKVDYIEPILRDIRDLYGQPLAVIRDMRKGVAKGVDNVFEGAVVIICHFHFLRALGDRLFKYYYKEFRKNVDKTGVKGKLEDLRRKAKTRLKTVRDTFAIEILNELVGVLDEVLTSSGEGLGYPFDLSKLR